ncbi:MAG: hypothetical protein JNL79_08280 [Myxococcales bacterium]|nr:hypothetical protein [Myxococcales bacterium]
MRAVVSFLVPLVSLAACSSADPAAPVSTDTGVDAVVDALVDTPADVAKDTLPDATAEGGGCPALGTTCPTGCLALQPREVDAAGKCLRPAVTVGCAMPRDAGACLGAALCIARSDTGRIYWLNAICFDGDLPPPWRKCSGTEETAVGIEAPACP